jgi:hypothetical protein
MQGPWPVREELAGSQELLAQRMSPASTEALGSATPRFSSSGRGLVRQPRCGSHALFLAWRLARGVHDRSVLYGIWKEYGCCGCAPGELRAKWEERRPLNRYTNFVRLCRGWAVFEGLPHDSGHPYLVAVTSVWGKGVQVPEGTVAERLAHEAAAPGLEAPVSQIASGEMDTVQVSPT